MKMNVQACVVECKTNLEKYASEQSNKDAEKNQNLVKEIASTMNEIIKQCDSIIVAPESQKTIQSGSVKYNESSLYEHLGAFFKNINPKLIEEIAKKFPNEDGVSALEQINTIFKTLLKAMVFQAKSPLDSLTPTIEVLIFFNRFLSHDFPKILKNDSEGKVNSTEQVIKALTMMLQRFFIVRTNRLNELKLPIIYGLLEQDEDIRFELIQISRTRSIDDLVEKVNQYCGLVQIIVDTIGYEEVFPKFYLESEPADLIQKWRIDARFDTNTDKKITEFLQKTNLLSLLLADSTLLNLTNYGTPEDKTNTKSGLETLKKRFQEGTERGSEFTNTLASSLFIGALRGMRSEKIDINAYCTITGDNEKRRDEINNALNSIPKEYAEIKKGIEELFNQSQNELDDFIYDYYEITELMVYAYKSANEFKKNFNCYEFMNLLLQIEPNSRKDLLNAIKDLPIDERQCSTVKKIMLDMPQKSKKNDDDDVIAAKVNKVLKKFSQSPLSTSDAITLNNKIHQFFDKIKFSPHPGEAEAQQKTLFDYLVHAHVRGEFDKTCKRMIGDFSKSNSEMTSISHVLNERNIDAKEHMEQFIKDFDALNEKNYFWSHLKDTEFSKSLDQRIKYSDATTAMDGFPLILRLMSLENGNELKVISEDSQLSDDSTMDHTQHTHHSLAANIFYRRIISKYPLLKLFFDVIKTEKSDSIMYIGPNQMGKVKINLLHAAIVEAVEKTINQHLRQIQDKLKNHLSSIEIWNNRGIEYAFKGMPENERSSFEGLIHLLIIAAVSNSSELINPEISPEEYAKEEDRRRMNQEFLKAVYKKFPEIEKLCKVIYKDEVFIEDLDLYVLHQFIVENETALGSMGDTFDEIEESLRSNQPVDFHGVIESNKVEICAARMSQFGLFASHPAQSNAAAEFRANQNTKP